MICPKCNSKQTETRNTAFLRSVKNGALRNVRRRYKECLKCGYRSATYEVWADSEDLALLEIIRGPLEGYLKRQLKKRSP